MAQKLVRYIEMEEFKKILLAEKDKKFKLAYVLGMGSGLRISEVVGLENEISRCCDSELEETKKQINEKKRKIWICSKCKKELELKDIKRGEGYKINPIKTENIDIEKHQIRILEAKRGKERITVTSPWLNKTNIELLPLDIPRRTLQGRFERLSKKVLGKKLNFHTLRHGFGNYMVNVNNEPIPIVQGMLGHSDISTTGIYTKSNPEQAVKTAWEAF